MGPLVARQPANFVPVTFLGYLVVGFLAGAAAALVTGVRRRGCLTTILTGIAGSLVGGYLFRTFGVTRPGSFLTAFVGAIALLVVLRTLGLARKR